MQNRTNPKPLWAPIAKKILAAVVIISLVGILGYFLTKTKIEIQNLPSTKKADETAEKQIDSQDILSDEEIYEILKEFADKQNAANISDDNILLDAIRFRNENIKERLEKAEYNLEETGKALADVIDLRGFVNTKTKVCIARSIIYDDLKHTCDLKDDSFISTENVDDILATEEIIPYFLVGLAYFKDGDYAKASYYLDQVILHRQTEKNRWGESYFFEVSGKIYGKIYEKTVKVLDEIKTADWENYRNEEYGFEVKYPMDWYAYASNPADVFIQETKEEAGNIPGPHADAFEIKVSVSEGQSLNKIIEDQDAQAGIKYNISNVKIGGIDGIKAVSVCDGVGCGSPEWLVIKNNNLYYFKSNLGYSAIFDQILSTFKFTKK